MTAEIPPCPVPEIGEALAPYVRPRDEVEAIRQRLQLRLEQELSISPSNPLTVANLHHPGVSISPDHEISPEFTGVRRAYIEALKAHAAAQAKYDALKADLQQMQSTEPPRESAPTPSVFNEHLLPLLQAREKNRRLKIIERTYNGINQLGEGLTSLSVDQLISRDHGDPPLPPPSDTLRPDSDAAIDAQIVELKKAIVRTKYDIDHPKPRTPSSRPPSAKTAEVAGLQEALNELTGWMEQQLAIIGGADEPSTTAADTDDDDSASLPTSPSGRRGSSADPPTVAEIQDLYAEYLAAREQLVRVIRNPPAYDAEDVRRTYELASPSTPARDPTEPNESASEVLLPHVAALVACKAQNELHAQQAAYLRRQIARSETETAGVVARLAGESHLVPPSATAAKDWVTASADANAALEEYLGQRMRAGKASTESAQRALAEMQRLKEVMANLDQISNRAG